MQNKILTDLGIKPSTLYWILAVLVGFGFAFPSLKVRQAFVNQDREDNIKLESKANKLQRQLEFEQQQAQIANKRYESCLPVVGEHLRNNTHYFTGIKEGDIPVDRISKKPLPKGTIICDANGTTGVIGENGIIEFLAYTGDRNVIQSRLKRFRGSQFSQPVIKEN